MKLAYWMLPLLALAACADDPAERPASGSRTAVVAAQPPPQLPLSRFDGRYVGTMLLNPDRTRACFPASTSERVMTVSGGRVTILVNPEARQVLQGAVNPDGSLRARDTLDRSVQVSGQIDGDQFLGTFTNGRCGFAISLRRR